MGRITISLNDDIMRALRRIQGDFIGGSGEEWSFTTIVNMVLLGGLLGSKRFAKKDWRVIVDFLEEQKLDLDLEAGVDTLASHALEMKGWGQVVQQMQLKEAEGGEQEEEGEYQE